MSTKLQVLIIMNLSATNQKLPRQTKLMKKIHSHVMVTVEVIHLQQAVQVLTQAEEVTKIAA